MNEADTCRKHVVPKLQAAGWDDRPHAINEQRTFTDGRIVFVGGKARRGKQKRADYLLRYRSDFPIAVVEAKARYKHAAEGLQQAKDYAEILGLRFAYATNGDGIVEFDYTKGIERSITDFPTPEDLWIRLRNADGPTDNLAAERLLTPTFPDRAKPLRYYQEIAVNRTVKAVLQERKRALLTLCTGAGKTAVAFQICWKLWQARWNARGNNRRPKILFLADRNVLIDDPMAKDFLPFGEARHRIAGSLAVTSRDMYFATYQTMARDESRPGLYREYDREFFDLIVVDECHRGSARDDSAWREILEWFEPATQIGMTATPRREENADSYAYFGDPLYEYSLARGIADGFLAPYRVHRVVTDYDAAGWRPSKGELDRYGREIPDAEYGTADFERKVALRARTQAIARHLAGFMAETDRFAKTIVFCVDQEHALEMRLALAALNVNRRPKLTPYRRAILTPLNGTAEVVPVVNRGTRAASCSALRCAERSRVGLTYTSSLLTHRGKRAAGTACAGSAAVLEAPALVSMISQWWVRRSSRAVVILGSPKTEGHSPKARLVVTMIEVRS